MLGRSNVKDNSPSMEQRGIKSRVDPFVMNLVPFHDGITLHTWMLHNQIR